MAETKEKKPAAKRPKKVKETQVQPEQQAPEVVLMVLRPVWDDMKYGMLNFELLGKGAGDGYPDEPKYVGTMREIADYLLDRTKETGSRHLWAFRETTRALRRNVFKTYGFTIDEGKRYEPMLDGRIRIYG